MLVRNRDQINEEDLDAIKKYKEYLYRAPLNPRQSE